MPDKEVPQWMTYLKRVGAVATALLAISGVIYGTASYFQSAEAAEEKHMQIQVASDTAQYKANKDREEGDLKTQLKLIDLELKMLADHADDVLKEQLLQQRAIILQRLQELAGADA